MVSLGRPRPQEPLLVVSQEVDAEDLEEEEEQDVPLCAVLGRLEVDETCFGRPLLVQVPLPINGDFSLLP